MATFRMFSLTVHKMFFFFLNSVEQKRALNKAFCVVGDIHVPCILIGSCHTATAFTIN